MKTSSRSRIHRRFEILALAALLAFSGPGHAGVNPEPTGGDGECEEGGASGDPGSGGQDSIHLTLSLGRAAKARPTDFGAYFSQAGVNHAKRGASTSVASIQANLDGSGVENLWQIKAEYHAPVISAAAFTPASLVFDLDSKAEVIKSGAVVRQVLTNDFLVDIQALPAGQEGYTAKWWPSARKGTKSGGFYVPVGSPVKNLTIANPNAAGTYTMLDMGMSMDMPQATTRSIHYRFVQGTSGANVEHRMETWTRKPGEAGAVQVAADVIEYLSGAPTAGSDPANQDRIRTIKLADLDGTGGYGALSTHSRTREVFANISGEKRLVSETKLASPTNNTSGLTTTYGYYDTPSDPLLHGRRRWQKNPDGSWKIWNITATTASQTIQEISPFKDGVYVLANDGSNVTGYASAEARIKQTTIVGTSMDTVETVLGQQVSRVVQDYLTGANGERVRRTRNYHTASAFFTTYRAYNAYGDGSSPGAGRIAWETHRDGTATVYTYSAGRTVTIASGRPSGSGESSAPVVNTSGTVTTRVYNEFWIPVMESVADIASNQITSSWEVPDPANDIDLYGRVSKIQHNGNPDDFESVSYWCCGPSERRGRSGEITTYAYDLLKRVYRSTRKGSTTGTPVVTVTNRSGLTTIETISAGSIPGAAASKIEKNLLGETIGSWGADADGDGDMEPTQILTEYLAAGKRTTETNPAGATRIEETYRDGQLKSTGGTGVLSMSYNYGSHNVSGGGLWVQSIRANGTEWMKLYSDPLGRPIRTEYPDGAYSMKTYHGPTAPIRARGNLLTERDADEVSAAGSGSFRTYTYGYDANNLSFAQVSEKMTDGQNRISLTTSGVAASVTLHGVALGPVRTTRTQVNGITTTEEFSGRGGYDSGSRSSGQETLTRQTVSADGSWTETTIRPDGTKERASYENGILKGREIFNSQGITPAHRVASTTYTYDDLGRILTSVDSRTGTTTINGFRNNGAVVSVTANGGSDTTAYAHDALGRVIATTLPDASVKRTRYTLRGEVQAEWGSQTYPSFRTFDGQGRLATLRTEPDLDGSGTPLNTGGNLTTWIYSASRGWLSEKNYDGETDTGGASDADYGYTKSGRLLTRKWERGVVTTYGYDQGGLETTVYSNDPSNTASVTQSYDAFGRVRTVTQGSGGTANTHTYAYKDDSNGSGGTLGSGLGLHSEEITYGAVGLTRKLLHHQDSLLRPAGWQLQNGVATEHSASYGYDIAGRLAHVDPVYPLPSTPAFAYAYEDHSLALVKSVTGPAHKVTNAWEAHRDVLDSMTNATLASTPVIFSAYDYTVNGIGQRTSVTVTGTAFGSDPRSRIWSYDALGQLSGESDQSDSVHSRGFSYDAIGNRLRSIAGSTDPNASGAVVYTAGALQQYSSITGMPAVPTYDADGNPQVWNIRPGGLPSSSLQEGRFTWDAENRPVEVKDASNATIASYTYDYLGRRILKVRPGIATRAFLYDDWNPIAEYTAAPTPAIAAKYLWGQDLSGSLQGAGGVGGLLSVTHSAGTFYAAYDGNGNVSEYVNAAGVNAAHFEYDAFGNLVKFTELSTGLAETFRHRFSTKMQDEESGLLYYGYRYYDAVAGRWLSRDRIEEQGGLNLYGFLQNNALASVDVLGNEEAQTPPKPRPPGFNPGEYPADFPPELLPKPIPDGRDLPIDWGEEVSPDSWPSEEDTQKEDGGSSCCKCERMYEKSHLARPKGTTEYPVPGMPYVACQPGKVVVKRYESKCVPKEEGKKCDKAHGKCYFYVEFKCVSENYRGGQRTYWGSGKPSVMSSCK